jgi:hypothetical protein
MKLLTICCALLFSLSSLCFAGLFPDEDKSEQLTNPPQLTVLIPYDKEVNAIRFTQLDFNYQRGGRPTKQEKIFIKNKKEGSFSVERRTDNGTSGSGKVYNVNYTVEKNKENMAIKFQPTAFKTYQQGLIMPFAVPSFSDQELIEYIANQQVFLSLDLDSPYNTESTYSNFMRLAERVPVIKGEKDPVTGKIYKDKFSLSYKYGKVFFSLETFPYRNGSKAVIHLAVPGSFTSSNEVDFGVIIKEIKNQLESIVNS